MGHTLVSPVIGMAAALQNVKESNEIGLDIGLWIENGIPHSGLGRQVDHDLRIILAEYVFHQSLVRNVASHKCKSFVLFQTGQPALL